MGDSSKRNPAKDYLREVREISFRIRRLKESIENAPKYRDCLPSSSVFDKGKEYSDIDFIQRERDANAGKITPAHAAQKYVSDSDPTPVAAASVADASFALDRLYKDSQAKFSEAYRYIEILTGIEEEIVVRYYFMAKTWAEVAVEIKYSWRHLHRIHSALLAKLNEHHHHDITYNGI